MKVAIMQPYLFPYLGYFQLVHWAEIFVCYNDVQFIKGGWINRNNILVGKKKHLFVFSIEKSSVHAKINERVFDVKKIESEKKRFIKTLTLEYSKAPYFNEVIQLIEKILDSFEANLSNSIYQSLILISEFLGINTRFINSDSLDYDRTVTAQQKVLDICSKLNATHYTNPIGGIELYDKNEFEKNNLKLNFISTHPIKYNQFNNDFVSNLSMIDVMMFNSKDTIKDFLEQYDLV
jgi:hypothetical protein